MAETRRDEEDEDESEEGWLSNCHSCSPKHSVFTLTALPGTLPTRPSNSHLPPSLPSQPLPRPASIASSPRPPPRVPFATQSAAPSFYLRRLPLSLRTLKLIRRSANLPSHTRFSSSTDLLLPAAKLLRSDLSRALYRQQRDERRTYQAKKDSARIRQVLYGGSAKKHLQTFSPPAQPFAVNTAGGALTSDPEKVKEETSRFFADFYAKKNNVPADRPWLNSAAGARIRVKTAADPFVWPQQLTLDRLRAQLRRGNRKPSPGPDGWEKWAVLLLSDRALTIVLKLLNYMLQNNYFSGVRRNFIMTMYKNRGLSTDLSNYRGVVFSCFLFSTASAVFTNELQTYSAKHGLIPASQIATQPGVQARDLTGYLSHILAWAKRHGKTVYSIVRDQMKGFDFLHAQAGYDAYDFFGLPPSVAAFDRARLAANSFQIKTPYGLSPAFEVDDQMKQGDNANPVRFALSFAPALTGSKKR